MLTDWNGKRLRAHGFKSLAAVKAQFRKAGHSPGSVADLKLVEFDSDGTVNRWQWECECGDKLRFFRKGNKFWGLCVLRGPFRVCAEGE